MRYFIKGPLTNDIGSSDANTLWSVLVDQNNVELIMKWIKESFSVQQSDEGSSLTFFKAKMTQEMVDSIMSFKMLTPENQELLLDYLSKYFFSCI